MSEEGRANIAAAVARRWKDPDQRDKMRAVGKRPPPSPETIKKMQAARAAVWDTPESKARRSAAMKKRWATEDGMAERLAESRRTPEAREKFRQWRLRRRFPPTDIEILLGDAMRAVGLEFEEQRPFMGRFIPDFTFEAGRLLVQADGEYWHRFERNQRFDRALRQAIAGTPWRMIRFDAADIKADPSLCAWVVQRVLAQGPEDVGHGDGQSCDADVGGEDAADHGWRSAYSAMARWITSSKVMPCDCAYSSSKA